MEFQCNIKKGKKSHTMSLVKYRKCETMATLILEMFSPWLEKILCNSVPEVGSNLKFTQFGRGGEEQPVTSKSLFLQEFLNDSVMSKTLLLLPAW